MESISGGSHGKENTVLYPDLFWRGMGIFWDLRSRRRDIRESASGITVAFILLTIGEEVATK